MITEEDKQRIAALNQKRNELQDKIDEIDDTISDIYYRDVVANPRPADPINAITKEIYYGAIKEQLGAEAFLVQWGGTQLITPKFRPQSQSIITNLSDN